MRSQRSYKTAYRSTLSRIFFNSSFRSALILVAVVAASLSFFVWQSNASANTSLTLRKIRQVFRSALNMTPVVAVQSGIGSRTIISTIAGGGFSTNAPVNLAPMVLPTAVATDPQGRGFYVIDDNNGTSLLRFVNTTANPVTLGGVTIQPGSINLIAGGGQVADTPSLSDIDLTLISGLAIDPTGNVVYMTSSTVNAIRAINVGTQDFTILRQTIQPGTIKTIFNLSRPDVRSLNVNAAREFFYIGTAPTTSSRVVYKLDPTGNNNAGLETIYAGGGTPQFGNGDGQTATQGKLTSPMGLAIDTNGNLLIAEGGDTRNNPGAVRRVDPGGIIQTLAGNLEFPTGIVLGPANSVYVALGNAQQIVRISSFGDKTRLAGAATPTSCDQTTNPTCGDGAAATLAHLNLPGSTQLRNLTLAADANGFYLPDFNYRRIRYVNLGGAAVNIAGTIINGGQINTVVGSGQESPYDNIPATITEMQMAAGVAEDPNGNLFVADTNADPVGSIRFINRGQTPVTMFANTAWALTIQPGQIATLNNKAGEPAVDDRIATAVFASPQGIYATANGLFIVDSQYGALVRPSNSLSGRRSGHIRFLNTSASDVTIFPNGGAAKVIVPPGYIKDIVGRNDAPLPGSPTADNAPAYQAIIFPTDVALDSAGHIYIADQGNNRIRRVDASTGQVTSLMTIGNDGPTPYVTGGACGLEVTAAGRVYIANTKTDTIVRQDAPGSTSFSIIANSTKGISRPRDLTVDAAGNVFVANSGTDQVLRVIAPTNALGTSAVVAGTGAAGFSGDGGAANRAKLNFLNPGIAATDIQVTNNIITLTNGDMVFADTENNRLRLLVQLPNQTPVMASVTNASVNEGQTATVNFSATDGNQDPLTFSVQNAPAFATLTDAGNGTASLQIAPGFADAGTYNVTVTVNDGDATDSKNFTITVVDVNRAPVVTVTPISPTYEATFPTGRQVNLLATASDPDGDGLTYQWFDFQSQIATTLTPQVTLAIGNHSLVVTVTDAKGLATSSTAFSVIVRDTTPPTINGVPADITIQATSDQGVEVNYTLPTAVDVVDGEVSVLADKSPASVFPVGATTVNFTAKDSRNNQATASFKVTVTPKPGDPPPPPPPPPPGGGGCNATGYTISTFAGSGNYGFSGDGGMAVDASLRSVSQLTRDSAGLMIVDSQSRVVRHVDASTVIQTIAGNSSNGNTGDGNLATFATFGATGGAVKDANGNIYVSDTNFHRIRRIATDGKIFHFAGATNGTSGSGGDNGSASTSRFNRPTSLAIDAAGVKLYVADTGNNRIRVIDLTTNIITSYAGTGGAGFNGDGVIATDSSLNNPSGLAVDANGNLLIADRYNHRIRRVDATSRLISTVAGDGNAGFGGDGGAATAAQLNNPTDIGVDANGNLYIADLANHRVRRVKTTGTPSGQIDTIAGNGTGGFSGDGGTATDAQLNSPSSIEVESDCSIYVGDGNNLRVRKLTPSTTGGTTNRNPVITSTIANQTMTKGQTLTLPLTANDEDGDMITFSLVNGPSFADIISANPTGRTATLRLQPTTAGTFSNIQIRATDGKGGTATSTEFSITVNEPTPDNQPPTANAGQLPATAEATSANGASVTLNGSGSDPDGDPLTYSWTDNGNVIATSAAATVTLSIGTHSIVLSVSDNKGAKTSTTAQTVLVKDSIAPTFAGVPAAFTTAATSVAGANVNYTMPTAADLVDGVVQVVADKASGSLFAVGTTTVNFTATDSRGNAAMASFLVTVTPFTGGTASSYNISTFAGNGNYGYSGDGGQGLDASMKSLTALTRDSNGLIIADGVGRAVRRIDAAGVIRTIAGNGANGNGGDAGQANYAQIATPSGAVTDANGNTYVSDTAYHRVRRVATDGKIYHFAGSTTGVSGSIGDNGPAASSRLNRPTALAVDSQNLYIVDSGNNRIRAINLTTLVISTAVGTGGAGFSGDGAIATDTSLNNPTGLALDAAGNMLIADRNNHRIRKVAAGTRIVTTIAGTGEQGFSGDGGQGALAQLNIPTDVGVDANGNVFFIDQANNRVRRINLIGTIETIAGNGTIGYSGDGGPALQAQISQPTSIEVQSDGSILVGDNGNLRIRKLTPSTTGGTTNRNPVISSTIANQTMTKGQTVDLPLTATDADNDSVTFTLLNAPAFASIVNANPAARTATLRLVPTAAGVSSNIQIRATDGKGGTATSAAFSITVNEPTPDNQPPTANAGQLPAMIEAVSAAGAPVALNGSGTDPDNDPVTFSWTDNDNVIATSAAANVTLGIGTHSIVLSVSDNKGAKTSTTAQTVIVKDSTAPTIAGVPAAITTAATSANGANVNYTMPTATDLVDGVVQVIADKASASLFAVGTTTVKFTATDSRGNAAMAQFVVTVTPFVSGETPTSYTISTFAGSGNYGFSGDGGPAIDAAMKSLTALTRNSNGLMIADSVGRVVRRIDTNGKISTIAGNGANGNGGDGGQANYAQIATPGGAVTDANGNTYVSDTAYHRIRRIAPDGKIFHYAGSTTGVAGSIGDNGPSASARFNRPTALAVDAQFLYVVDSGNNKIRTINLTTTIVSTAIGTGGAGFGGDGVLATDAALNNPVGMAIDAAGNIFIADRNNHRIRKVNAVTKLISTVAGTGEAGFGGDSGLGASAQINTPTDVAVDASGNVFFIDQANNRVRRVNAAGVIETIAGNGTIGFSGDGGPALQAQISQPTSIEVESDGSIHVGDNGNLRVRKLTPAGPPPPPPPPANNIPVITSTTDNQTITKGQTVDLPLTATDADNDSVTFTLLNAPAFASIINANPTARTATLRLVPTAAGVSSNIQIKADDGKGGTATSAAFSITVNEPVNLCIAAVPANNWKGEYFPNLNLSGSPLLVRNDGDGALNLDFGDKSPSSACGLPTDNFSARYTREVSFQAGSYHFQLFGDDGIRLYVDGVLKIDKWINQGETKYEVDVALTGGNHTLRVEHFEATGAAAARLFWNASNYYPTVNNIANQTVRRGQSVDVVVTASDSDNDPVSLTLQNAPSFITLINANPAQRTATLRIAPPAGDTDVNYGNLTIKADDGRGGQSFSNQFTINVTSTPPPPANRAPVAVANTLATSITAPDETGATIALDGSASSDPDGDALSYNWTDQGFTIATTAVVSIKLPVGTHLIALTVNDGKGGVNSTVAQSVTISAPAPPPPASLAIDSLSPSSGKKGATLTIIVNGSGFIPGATVTINGGSITTYTTYVSPTQLRLQVSIASNAFTTTRSVTVANPGGASAGKSNAFSVLP